MQHFGVLKHLVYILMFTKLNIMLKYLLACRIIVGVRIFLIHRFKFIHKDKIP